MIKIFCTVDINPPYIQNLVSYIKRIDFSECMFFYCWGKIAEKYTIERFIKNVPVYSIEEMI